jgi:hypothetical protein
MDYTQELIKLSPAKEWNSENNGVLTIFVSNHFKMAHIARMV